VGEENHAEVDVGIEFDFNKGGPSEGAQPKFASYMMDLFGNSLC